jgi:hypothetical protein
VKINDVQSGNNHQPVVDPGKERTGKKVGKIGFDCIARNDEIEIQPLKKVG